MIEIAKCLSFHAKVIILDEPTASLTDNEALVLFDIIRELRKQGISIVYISHRMEEVFGLADRITVFRDGTYIDTVRREEINEKEIIKMMIGRELEEKIPKGTAVVDENNTVLEIRNVRVFPKAAPLSFKLYRREILGFLDWWEQAGQNYPASFSELIP